MDEASPATVHATAEYEAVFSSMNDLEQKLAWHAGAFRHGRWQISLLEAKDYAAALPIAINLEKARIEGGAPKPYPKLTPTYVTQLVTKHLAGPPDELRVSR